MNEDLPAAERPSLAHMARTMDTKFVRPIV